MLKKWFKKLTAKKWQTCGGLTVSKKWAKGVTVIETMRKCDDEWKIRMFNEKTSWVFFTFPDAYERAIAYKILSSWIEDVQG